MGERFYYLYTENFNVKRIHCAPLQLRGSPPVLSGETGRPGVFGLCHPVEHSHFLDPETGRPGVFTRWDKVTFRLFHLSHEGTGREPRRSNNG